MPNYRTTEESSNEALWRIVAAVESIDATLTEIKALIGNPLAGQSPFVGPSVADQLVKEPT